MTERRFHRAAAPSWRESRLVPVPGDLLVSSVLLEGDAFAGAVVLLLEVDETGAVGVVLNRPADTDVDDIFPGWGSAATWPGLVCCGGPVASDGALCLTRLRPDVEPPEGWHHTHGNLGLVGLDADVVDVAPLVADLRVFVGYAGWGPEQLRQEIAQGAWHVLPSRECDAFDEEPETLWRRVLRRVHGDLAYFSTWTDVPEWN